MANQFAKATVTHDRENCIGCGMCALICPRYWTMSPMDGKSDLTDAVEKKGMFQRKVVAEDVEENKEAAEACPVRVIKVQ